MTRLNRFKKLGYTVMWLSVNDDEFYISDEADCYFLDFYLNNENKKLVDIYFIKDTSNFDPVKFDVINGVPDLTYTESFYWKEVA